MAGHSKWTQIKHRKAITDARKGTLFSKMVREIMLAARTGQDPSANARLRSALEQARAIGLPKDNIERAIARASGAGEGGELSEIIFEATGPGGVAIIAEAITDSKNRTVNEIKHLLSQYDARMSEPGSVMWNFEKIGIVEITADQNPGKTKDEMESAIIESGAADFCETHGSWILETAFADTESVRAGLEERGIAVKETGHDYKPRATIAPLPEKEARVSALLEALSEHDDIQEIYTNLSRA